MRASTPTHRLAAQHLGQRGLGEHAVVVVDQRDERRRHQHVVGVAEDAEGGVEAVQAAVEIGDAEQIERQGEELPHLVRHLALGDVSC